MATRCRSRDRLGMLEASKPIGLRRERPAIYVVSPEVAESVDDPFTLPGCAPVDPPARCEAVGWSGGVASGAGVVTDDFSVCMDSHVICKFTNTSQECPENVTAIGDLKALGGVENEPVGFATAAVPLRTGDAEDSIFLASFIPLSEGSRWPGEIDHYILPLPVI